MPQRPSSLSTSSSNLPVASHINTAPPWAKDEPPSPTELPVSLETFGTESRLSDVASYQSASPSRWWAFTLPRPRDGQPNPQNSGSRRKERSLSWLGSSNLMKDGNRKDCNVETVERTGFRDWNLSITLPTPVQQPFTLSHNATPGWDTPWSARMAAQGPSRRRRDGSFAVNTVDEQETSSARKSQTRRKKFRTFLLTNTYVPLLFRFINIAFTTAALGVAIRIRQWEKQNNVMGVVGSSPTLVIIFAPLTLVHVMAAVYLEYFGRPLGLWRTSAKLTHTLSEVLFICAWSAALSLCFDNFFTSLVPCASPSSISWYNQLPRPPTNLPNFEGSIGDKLCDSQLALICLVGVGLLMYCINLVISLFRIFEKVKYHPAALRSSP